MPNPKDQFYVKASRLARAAPKNWHDFLNEFAALVEKSRTDCIKSEPAYLQINQGRAQQMTALLEDLQKCQEISDKIEGKTK